MIYSFSKALLRREITTLDERANDTWKHALSLAETADTQTLIDLLVDVARLDETVELVSKKLSQL